MEEGDIDHDEDFSELSNFSINGYQLSNDEYGHITSLNNSLNESPLFRTSNLKNKQWLDAERTALGGEIVTLETADQCLVTCYYFNNGKDKIVLVAPGFGGGFEEMMPLIEIYKDYDVLLLDYWGHGPHDARDESKTAWYRNPADRFFSERFRREHLDIEAALAFINNPAVNGKESEYTEIIGAGNCYSTLVLSKVQADAEQNNSKAFDKLIFDSSWLSTHSVALKVAHDPYLSFDQIHGNAPWLLQKFMDIPYLDKGLLKLGEAVLGIDLDEHSILQHLPHITCPILFIQGTGDKLVTTEEFQTILDNSDAPRLVLTTPFKHSVVRFKGKEICKFAVNLFIDNPDALMMDQSNAREMLEDFSSNKASEPAQTYSHTSYTVVPQPKKFFNTTNTIVSLVTLGAALFVFYVLYTAPGNKTITTNAMANLK